MSIQSGFGNFSSQVGNSVQTDLTQLQSRLGNIMSSVSTTVSGLWDGGFVGISKAELEGTLIPAIESYCDTIENQIAAYNAAASTAQSFKGLVEGSVSEFIAASKEALQAYVSTMRQEIARANSAYEQWKEGQTGVSGNLSSNASEIRSAAANIKLD